MSEKPQVVVKGFSLTKKEVKIIERVSNKLDIPNDSAALRKIINEWADQKAVNIKEIESAPTAQ